jgi:RES domain-containing protein
MPTPGRVHDRAILDALEAIVPVSFDGTVWRVTRADREAIRGSDANGRWNPGEAVEVLYTSLERAGALAEIGFRLSLEPVWPSRIEHEIHEISARAERTLRFANVSALAPLGVDGSKYGSFDYETTQAIAAAAHFLELDGLIVPSARHPSLNLVVFMDREAAVSLDLRNTEKVDWSAWRSPGRRAE